MKMHKEHIIWPENCRSTHSSIFVIENDGKICELLLKNYASFCCLTGQWIDTTVDKSRAFTCSPVHKKFKTHRLVLKLQAFVYVAVIKKFTIFFQQ